ncbi:MAG: NAD(P)H-hydrate epimerase [Sphaerochaetaceae bacterium]
MEKLVTTQTMENIDRRAQSEWEIPPLLLMENAGVKGWQAFIASAEKQWYTQSIVFVAGGGNNGGDALVMAREAHLTGFTKIKLILVGSRLSEAALIQRKIVTRLGLPMLESGTNEAREELMRASLIIDGIVGTGLRGPLKGEAEELVKFINAQKERGAHILSIDAPSGCSDTFPANAVHVLADTTVTMGLGKSCAYHPYNREGWGEILKVNPSFPLQLLEEAPPEAFLSYPQELTLAKLEESAYKNRRGHLALFAGSTTYPGAAKLAAKGAFNSRCGLVTLFGDSALKPLVAQESSSLILRESPVRFNELKGDYNAIVAGPGWSQGEGKQLLEILSSALPLVLDAAAIDLFATLLATERIGKTEHGPLVLTPHPGELNRLLETLYMPLLAQECGPASSSEEFLGALKKIVHLFEVTLVYKSSLIWIVDPNHPPVVVEGRNNAMGVAGSGDVLSGIIGSLLAQGLPPFEAAHTGVLIHQQAGLAGREKWGYFDSETLVNEVGLVCRRAEERL